VPSLVSPVNLEQIESDMLVQAKTPNQHREMIISSHPVSVNSLKFHLKEQKTDNSIRKP
jgi:hypothetical protein